MKKVFLILRILFKYRKEVFKNIFSSIRGVIVSSDEWYESFWSVEFKKNIDVEQAFYQPKTPISKRKEIIDKALNTSYQGKEYVFSADDLIKK
jgi:hypothetical protein